MKRLLFVSVICLAWAQARADVVFSQPPSSSGGLYHSSWWDPDGSDYDQYVWDGFTLSSSQALTEVHWRGGFDPAYFGSGGPVIDFTVEIWSSILGGSQPDIGSVFAANPLVHYTVGGNAGQTFAGTFGGVAMYDYQFALPAAFQAAAGTKYWVQIEAWQHGIPDWGVAVGTGGDGNYFRRIADVYYQIVPGDAAFALLTLGAATYTITASAAPAIGGAIQGAGAYPAGATASLMATPNPGFGFVNWTENNVQVSTSTTYTFTVNADRTLVANFTPAYTITTSASPSYGGSTSGGGTFNSGSSVTVVATPNPGFVFVDWTWLGTPLSSSTSYAFTPTMDMQLVANFATDPATVLFDFDNAPIHTSLPIDLTIGGLTAHLSATGQGFSIQPANTTGFTPAGFAGLCIYPNSVFAADLLVSFTASLTDFSIMYSPQELGCDDSATMRVTAYLDGTFVGTNTATAPIPGTWPTGTLAIAAAPGFNSVVVHYDHRPPTCQDWGPIFLADNMIVTLAPAPVSIASANPPAAAGNPYAPGAAFRDVLDTGMTSALTAGIGGSGTATQGDIAYAQIAVNFSGAPTPPPVPMNVTINCTGGACPTVVSVSGSGAGPYDLALSGPIPPRECTTLTFAGTSAGQKLQYQSLPGDVNLDGSSNTQDLLALVQALNNGTANQTVNWARYNVDRSTQPTARVNTQDLLREVQLLNGVNTTQVFNGGTVAACP